MAEIKGKYSIINIPDSAKTNVSVFVIFPGIAVTCAAGENEIGVTPVAGKHIGKEYMPPSVKKGVPDWFDKYVLVFVNTHLEDFSKVEAEYKKELDAKSLTISDLNITVFSGSGSNLTIPYSRSDIKSFVIMDATVSNSLINGAKSLITKGTKVFLMYKQSNWGGVVPNYFAKSFSNFAIELKGKGVPENNIADVASSPSKYGFGDVYTLCGQSSHHMTMPEKSLAYWKSDLEALQTPPSASTTPTGSSASTAQDATANVINDKLINGKIIITKKSGPGELTGVNEVELVQVRDLEITKAEFKSEINLLQFTEPGDYVLSITCTDDRVEPYELKVKVTKEDEIIAQPESKGTEPEKKPVDGTRPIIAQIDKPTIVVPPIKMNKDGTSPDQDSYTKGMGYTPLIWYKAYAIEDRSLKSMRLYHEGLIPMIEFTFEDTKEILKSEATPKDDATIDLFLNSTSKNLKSIHMIFKIKGFVQGTQAPSQTYTVTGTANIPSLYVQNNKSYQGTSFETLRQICKELEIGFNSNIKDTKDTMSWRNTNKKPYEFMDEIISRSYINDESYMAGYIDYYYCFNYVDLEKEMNRDASKDLGLDSSAMSEQSKTDEIERLVSLRLTNEQSQNASSNFIGSYTTLNESTKKSLQNGYATITKTYDRLKKQFLVFTVDSTTSDGVESHILKGGEFDDKYQKENVKHKFLGKIDTDNVHADYNYAVTQNRINLNNLNKIVLNATLPNANWNLYKFMKIAVDLVNPSSTITNPSVRDFRYSGYYIIADIEYYWNGKSMSQKLRLVKKELGKTLDEIKNDPPQQKKPEVKENNTNPVGTTASTIIPAPNSVYNVGQTYLVQDKSGKLYNLTVTNLLENGIEVAGTLKESPIGMSSSTSGNLVSTTTNTSGGTTSSTTGVTPSVALPPNVDKPFNTPNEIKNFQDWLDSNYPTWLQNGKLNKSAGYGNYGTNTKNAYKAYGVIYNNYLSAKGMTQSTT